MSEDPIAWSHLSRLNNSIQEQIKSTDKQSQVMNRLTWVAIALTFVQAIAAGIQIWDFFRR